MNDKKKPAAVAKALSGRPCSNASGVKGIRERRKDGTARKAQRDGDDRMVIV